MTDLHLEHSKNPLSEAEIEKFEKEIGHRLPSQYRDFLLRHNGGWPSPCVFVLPDGRKVALSYFLFLNASDGETYGDLRSNSLTFSGRVPNDLLPIANCASLLCIGLYGENEGQIFYWDQEAEAESEEKPTYDNVYKVADTFNELLAMLQEE
jgi:hypothetical protein